MQNFLKFLIDYFHQILYWLFNYNTLWSTYRYLSHTNLILVADDFQPPGDATCCIAVSNCTQKCLPSGEVYLMIEMTSSVCVCLKLHCKLLHSYLGEDDEKSMGNAGFFLISWQSRIFYMHLHSSILIPFLDTEIPMLTWHYIFLVLQSLTQNWFKPPIGLHPSRLVIGHNWYLVMFRVHWASHVSPAFLLSTQPSIFCTALLFYINWNKDVC